MKNKALDWHSGPPPHAGWWEASYYPPAPDLWRWWDGEQWSPACEPTDSADYAAAIAKMKIMKAFANRVRWRWNYPKHARVPRIDPRDVVRSQIYGNAAAKWRAEWSPL